MTDDAGSGEGTGGAPAPGEPAADTTAVSLGELTPDILDLDAAGTVDDALALIDQLRPTPDEVSIDPHAAVVNGFYDSLGDAYATGALKPSETTEALEWVQTSAGVSDFTSAFVLGGLLTTWLLLWGVHHGRAITSANAPGSAAGPVAAPPVTIPVAPTPTPKAPVVTSTVTIGPVTEGTATPGGKLVEAAQRTIAPVTITVPGLKATTARAIGVAIEASYQDTMLTVISVANALSDQIDAVGRATAQALGEVAGAVHLAGEMPTSVASALDKVNATLERLESGQSTLDTRIANVEAEVKNLPKPTTSTTTITEEKVPQSVTTELEGLKAVIPTLATAASVSALQTEVQDNASAISGLEAELQTAGVPDLPNTVASLEECCDDAHEVTDPIADGGATPSLLRQLGGLLTEVYALGIVASFVGTLVAIFDMDTSVVGTIRAAEWVAPFAERAAISATTDISWGDVIAGVSS